MGLKRIFLPQANVPESSVIPDIDVIGVESLGEVVEILSKEKEIRVSPRLDISDIPRSHMTVDFSSIHGQSQAKRALLIAAAGGHNILMQ